MKWKRALFAGGLGMLVSVGWALPAPSWPEGAVDRVNAAEEPSAVLCPFMRILTKEAWSADAGPRLMPKLFGQKGTSVVEVAGQFGLERGAALLVADAVAKGQGHRKWLDLDALHAAGETSHACGYTFEPLPVQGPDGGDGFHPDTPSSERTLDRLAEDASAELAAQARADPGRYGFAVSDERRERSLAELEALAEDGELTWTDLATVKQQRCVEDGVQISDNGEVEINLIFAFLGGPERGTVPLSGVRDLLHARLPAQRAFHTIDIPTLDRISKAHGKAGELCLAEGYCAP